jgi:hypothetical protein
VLGIFLWGRNEMILTKKQKEEFEKASRPLMKFLGDNFYPHVTVIVEYHSAEILESSGTFKTEDYVKN